GGGCTLTYPQRWTAAAGASAFPSWDEKGGTAAAAWDREPERAAVEAARGRRHTVIDSKQLAYRCGDAAFAQDRDATVTGLQEDTMAGRMIEFEANGSTAPGYLATPDGAAAADAPGVVVLHAWWGLTEPFRQACDRLAEAGFV